MESDRPTNQTGLVQHLTLSTSHQVYWDTSGNNNQHRSSFASPSSIYSALEVSNNVSVTRVAASPSRPCAPTILTATHTTATGVRDSFTIEKNITGINLVYFTSESRVRISTRSETVQKAMFRKYDSGTSKNCRHDVTIPFCPIQKRNGHHRTSQRLCTGKYTQ